MFEFTKQQYPWYQYKFKISITKRGLKLEFAH